MSAAVDSRFRGNDALMLGARRKGVVLAQILHRGTAHEHSILVLVNTDIRREKSYTGEQKEHSA
jgi:hypothetical protein